MGALIEELDIMSSTLSNGLTKIALYFIAQCGIVLRAVAQQTVEEEQIEEVDLLCRHSNVGKRIDVEQPYFDIGWALAQQMR